MTARWRLPLALALVLGAAACGGDAGSVDQSIVVIHVNFDASLGLHQIKVSAHLANGGLDDQLLFPATPRPEPIPSGATLALLIPTTRSGLLDLIVTGLDGSQTAVAMSNGQTTIAVGARVDVTINLNTCASPGC